MPHHRVTGQPSELPEPSRSLRLSNGQAAIFGYGSLLSQRSMELTLGRPYTGPRVACALSGWRRSWDVIMPNTTFFAEEHGSEFVPEHIIYLNVRPSSGAPANGVLYVLGLDELEAFDRREWIYDRRAVTSSLRGVVVEAGEAYVYVAKAEWTLDDNRPRSWAALRQSYLDIVEQGLNELEAEVGGGFREAYEQSTDAVPSSLIFADRKREAARPSAKPS